MPNRLSEVRQRIHDARAGRAEHIRQMALELAAELGDRERAGELIAQAPQSPHERPDTQAHLDRARQAARDPVPGDELQREAG